MLVLQGNVENPHLNSVANQDEAIGHIRFRHNAPLQMTLDIYTMYQTFPKFIMRDLAFVHHHDLYKNFEHISIMENTMQDAIIVMQEVLKDEYYIVHDLSMSNNGVVSVMLIDINDVYLSGQPLRYFRYNIIDEVLRDMN